MIGKIIKLNENDIRTMVSESVRQILDINGRRRLYESQLKECVSPDEDVMRKFFNIDSNGCRPILMERINLNRIIGKHGDNGLIIISGNRTSNTREQNELNANSLRKDIENAGYSYLPAYGGYENDETGEYADYEPSFIVFNYSVKGEPRDFSELKNYGIEWCGKYKQDSFTIKEPNKPAYWMDSNGNKANKSETDMVYKNDPTQQYFTSLVPQDRKNELEKRYGKKYHHRRFTYDIVPEGYVAVNPVPATLNERRRRESRGEVMIWE